MRSLPATAAAIAVTMPVAAQTAFDGVYRQGLGADCAAIGQDGGALQIEDGVFTGVESQCRMTNPVDVRGMEAVLYDMACSGEGSAWSARAMFMLAADGGLILVWDGFAFKYDRCSVPADVEGVVTTAPTIGVDTGLD